MVIAVIALLMALLLPGLRKARESVMVTVCATHLDQMHTALHLGLTGRENGRLPTSMWGMMLYGPQPGPGGYRGDQFGFFAQELDDLGWTYEVSLCPGLTPDTGGDRRRGFWYVRKPSVNGRAKGSNGGDYMYTGGRADHRGAARDPNDPQYYQQRREAFGNPRFGFVYGKAGGIYYSVDGIYSGTITYDENGQNPFRDETYPSDVIYLGDVSYNEVASYPGWYYAPYVDPSNHRDTSVQNHKSGTALWPAIGRGSNRMKADGSIEWWNFPVKNRGKGDKMGGAYVTDYEAVYY